MLAFKSSLDRGLTNFCQYAKHDSIFEGEKVSEDTEYLSKKVIEGKERFIFNSYHSSQEVLRA